MKMAWCTIIVENMEESLSFYKDIVGLKLINRFASNDSEIAFLGEGETKIELMSSPSGKKSNIGDDISIGFFTDSLEKTYEWVKEKGVEIYREPFQPNDNIKFFFVKDPNGVKVQFAEEL